MKRRVEIGILYSRSGHYPLLSEACRAGALLAVERINRDPTKGLELVPVERDPGGNIDRYAPLCDEILTRSAARHIIGCITSWSRKEVIPVLEKHGGTLWYACPYEGFEANEHVVYMHACPNQQIVPLFGYAVPRFGADAFLLGSNYIWGWETNRVARDLVSDVGGRVLGERYLPLGDTDVGRLVAEIRATGPSFVLNNLIGPSSYAFLKAYAALGAADPAFRPDRRPVLSCNLTEVELPAIGPAADGHLSVGPYFHDAGGDDAWLGSRPGEPAPAALPGRPSSFMAAAYSSVTVLADLLAAGLDPSDSAAFAGRTFATPLGRIAIDPQTRHASLPVKIAHAQGGAFETLVTLADRLAPDPYLSRYDPAKVFARRTLRVVS
ncbi:transporter substrate-binding protein [Propylenella binzhouense]|uniref:N-acetylmuramoyl-L-alanine amidase n=1 Tax=Propylenella binzhouense TaxID=2555902 RepID=A0A964T5A3_9HYPH|nr:transporter substrate-binding protein [Propylenella binzhouense]MYZ48773.1 N-acetylmuramoyl-L-alanine amidase [Propylenella binzhouense]